MKNIVRIDTIADAHSALGLEKPKHPLVSVLPIDDKLLNFDYGDTTFVFGFYEVSMKSGISGSIQYGRSSYDFQEGSMVFTKPGQTLSFGSNTERTGVSGWSLAFHPELIRKSKLGETINRYSFFSYDVREALHLSEEERVALTEITEKIKREYHSNIDQHSQKLIVSNIELLLDYCTRYYDRQFYVRSNLNQDFVTAFENLLQKHFESDKGSTQGLLTVKQCGDEMNMSPAYLSDLLKKETGKSAQLHIQEALIERAKMLLLGGDNQVGQIAYDLGFDYPQHFSKLFKSKTGLSPNEFRKLH